MQKNVTQLKCIVNSKEIIVTCDVDCSTHEVKEALYQFLKYVGQVEDNHAQKLKEEQDSKVEILDDSKHEEIMVE